MAGRQQTLLDDNLCFTFTAKMEFSFVRFRVWFIQSQSMPPPNLPACHLCGRQFGTSSLAIHLKTCKEKWEREHNKPAPEPSAAIPTGAK